MSLKSLVTSLLQVTNIVLMLRNSSPDIRKFVVWRVDKSNPQEVLNRLEIESATFNDSLKIFEHPLETGAVITDHVIKDPNEALIQAYIAEDDADTLKELEYLYINAIPLKLRVENTVIDISKVNPESDVKTIKITLSLGIYEMKENDNDEDLLKKADKALYQAKNTGRNKVVVQDE